MTRLIARKVNFSHFKGNYNNPVLTNMVPTAIGPGGFVVPKMYHLNVESEKRIEASQNILAMISRKNVNKNIFPLWSINNLFSLTYCSNHYLNL